MGHPWEQQKSDHSHYLTVDKQVLKPLRASCSSSTVVLNMWANMFVFLKQTKVKRHLPSNPCCRGKLSPKVLFSCLLLRKVTSSSLLWVLGSHQHATTKHSSKLTPDSGSSRRSDTTARGLGMRRSDNAAAGARHVTVWRLRRAACFLKISCIRKRRAARFDTHYWMS